MPVYKAPVADTLFLLTDVFDLNRYSTTCRRFADAPLDTVEAVLGEAGKFAEERVAAAQPFGRPRGLHAPCGRVGDDAQGVQERPTRRSWRAAGSASPARRQYGGQGLPHYVGVLDERISVERPIWRFRCIRGLTNGAAAALLVHANDEIKQTYLPKLTSGEWTGTMNLTEPHCGTDLGLIKTKRDAPCRRIFRDHGAEDFHLLRRA